MSRAPSPFTVLVSGCWRRRTAGRQQQQGAQRPQLASRSCHAPLAAM